MAESRLIGLLGGTFDPVHYGHLRPARAVRERLGLDEVRLVPAKQPAHRAGPMAGADRRVEMLRLALEEFPDLVLDTRELDRDGPSYTFDTLSDMRRTDPGATWCWIMGSDALQGFTGWHRWRGILELAHLVVAVRPGHRLSGEAAALLRRHAVRGAGELRRVPAGGIMLLDVEAPDIAATTIRAKLARGEPVEGLTPAPVARWLEQHPLYKGQTQEISCN